MQKDIKIYSRFDTILFCNVYIGSQFFLLSSISDRTKPKAKPIDWSYNYSRFERYIDIP